MAQSRFILAPVASTQYNSMIKSGKQALSRIEGSCGQYQVCFTMLPEAGALRVTAEDNQTHESYSQLIDQTYVALQDEAFRARFQKPVDLFENFNAGFKDILISGGLLSFKSIPHGQAFTIKLIQDQISSNTQLREEKLEEHFTSQLLLRDMKINALAEDLQKSSERTSKFQQSFKNSVKRNTELVLALEGMEKLIKALSLEIQDQKLSIKLHSEQLNLGHHPCNSHSSNYILTNHTSSSIRLTKNGENGWYNFVNKFAILPQSIIKYSVKINASKDRELMIGFCTDDGFGYYNNFDSFESTYYYCSGPGYLYESGKNRPIDVGVALGDVIDCAADLVNGKFSWSRNNSKFVECGIPTKMKGKVLYLSVLQHCRGDEVDIHL